MADTNMLTEDSSIYLCLDYAFTDPLNAALGSFMPSQSTKLPVKKAAFTEADVRRIKLCPEANISHENNTDDSLTDAVTMLKPCEEESPFIRGHRSVSWVRA
ncbi:hypothetical protein EGR_00004 [Echinococcus granulosus]|uniref:Uncharacterized protein n=1 Tax=Echinococcus granulosus TaxID=6210 RepID=W6USW8_ECHGR|nr:hypothetical protein EGR_00004 [Echinococcus granulosus]EUB64735.1 hypothetical protein EGR_00004 [Echinococcus granulosus]